MVGAALDVPGSVLAAVNHPEGDRLPAPRAGPAGVGPEADPELLATAAEEADCPSAAPLGAYPAVGQLIASAYLAALPQPAFEEQPEA
ncbi:hypothetical protein GCM10020229_64380 [Kitasatospora albolonga]